MKGRTIRLTSQQLSHSIVLDFESFKDGPPLLCGSWCNGEFKQVVLDDRLSSAAAAKGLSVRDRRAHLRSLVALAEHENRLVVAFSYKERDDIRDVTSLELGKRYVNALILAKEWRKRLHPSAHEEVIRRREQMRQRKVYINGTGNRLTDFVGLIGLETPRDYGRGCEAQRIRYVMKQLERRGYYSALTAVAKAKWTKALKHNGFDVCALKRLCQRIVTDFHGD